MSAYYDVLGHGSMIFDHARNYAYEKAILANVRDDSVVLDLGSGLGLHGLMAAKAGAKKVYLVDPSPAVLVAEKVARANGLDNVECIQGNIEDISIEKVDLIISVFTGNFLLTEDLLPSLFYARDHFLKPSGKLIPSRGRMMVMPVSSTDCYQLTVERWKDNADKSISKRFGLSYDELTGFASNALLYDDFTRVGWSELAGEKVFCELDFYQATKAECFEKITVQATSSGLLHGWLGWFDMLLSDTWLSTSPKAEKLHWSQVFIPALNLFPAAEGDNLLLDIKRPEFGDWTWLIDNLGKTGDSKNMNKSKVKSQSTFLSAPINIGDVQKKSPAYRASLSAKGEILKQLLLLLDGTRTNREVAEYLFLHYPEKFIDLDSATRYLQKQIMYLC